MRATSLKHIVGRGAGLVGAVIGVLGVVLTIGQLLGLGPASLLAGFIALFGLAAAFGAPLRADLRLMAVRGPVMVVATTAPRLLAAHAPDVAIAALSGVVFIAGLLPVSGPRFSSVGLGLGMAALFAYGIPLPTSASPVQLVGAALLAVLFVLVAKQYVSRQFWRSAEG